MLGRADDGVQRTATRCQILDTEGQTAPRYRDFAKLKISRCSRFSFAQNWMDRWRMVNGKR